MRLLLLIVLILCCNPNYAQVTLSADGPGDTYELISSVLAPKYDPFEVPDCGHKEFGPHIDEVFDNELNTYVFRFYIHASPDNDRCITFDRQRNEIKAYDKSPDNLLGIENEKVVYKWKFKLSAGFQSSPKFTHLHQLKSVGGDFSSKPMYTLTTRKSKPDRLELRYAETDKQITLAKTDLAPFIDVWLDVTETIKYGTNGNYDIEIKRVSDGEVLLEYSNKSIVNWRPDADFVRPKWGIYRSLVFAEDLRDESVLFADFSIEELKTSATGDSNSNKGLVISSDFVAKSVSIKSAPYKIRSIQMFDLKGIAVLNKIINGKSDVVLDISSLQNGAYIIKVEGNEGTHAEIIFHLR